MENNYCTRCHGRGLDAHDRVCEHCQGTGYEPDRAPDPLDEERYSLA